MIRANSYDAFPPGHFSPDSLRGFLRSGGYRNRGIGDMTYDELVDEGWAVVGSPQTVSEQMRALIDELGGGRVVHIADNGAMPNWMVRKSLTLVAEQVIPYFRAPRRRANLGDSAPAPSTDPRTARRSCGTARGGSASGGGDASRGADRPSPRPSERFAGSLGGSRRYVSARRGHRGR